MAILLNLLGIIATLVISFVLYKYLNKKYTIEDLRYNKTVEVFDPQQVANLMYLRYEIVIDFHNIEKFDLNAFKELEIENHRIENNRLVFRFIGDNDYNYLLYLKIKERVKGE